MTVMFQHMTQLACSLLLSCDNSKIWLVLPTFCWQQNNLNLDKLAGCFSYGLGTRYIRTVNHKHTSLDNSNGNSNLQYHVQLFSSIATNYMDPGSNYDVLLSSVMQSLCSIYWDEEVQAILAMSEDEIHTKILEMPIEKLESQDQSPYRWRITNSLAAICRDDMSKPEIENKIRAIFAALKERDLLWLTEEQDNDGDTCLHSACNSRNPRTAGLLLEFFPNECKKALQTLNKKQRTPLHVSLNKSDRKTLHLLLSFCIQHKICQEIIGVRLAKQFCTHEGGRTTLMHEAMEKGFGVEYMKTFLPIIIDKLGDDAAKSSLVTYDEACNSAWYYMVERGDFRAIHNVLDEVKQRLPGISTTDLYVNCKKQTVLHQAYRDNLKRTIEELVEEDEELVDAGDANGILPLERLHSIYNCPKKRRTDVSIHRFLLLSAKFVHSTLLTNAQAI